jgi:hypothetical protein
MSISLLSSPAAPQAFNGDFYVTAASVIPVLFLAVALQSQLQQDLLTWVFRPMRRELYRPPAITVRQTVKYVGTLYFTVLGTFAVGLLIFLIAGLGVLGEILAIAALATKSTARIAAQLPGMTVEDTVLFSVEFLTIVVAATSALVLAKFVGRLLGELRDLRRQRMAANGAALGDWLTVRVPDDLLRERLADARTFPASWQPDAPDDGGFSDPVTAAHGHVIVYVSPQAGLTVQQAYPDIASGGQVTVTDSSGNKIGAGTLTSSRDFRQAAVLLERARYGDGPAAGPQPTASELAASGAVYDFTVTVPWLVRYGITVGRQETYYYTAAQMGGLLLVFTASFD